MCTGLYGLMARPVEITAIVIVKLMLVHGIMKFILPCVYI